MTGPPPGCPWMGHRNYSKMASVPIMLTQELWDFVDYISPTKEEHQIREYVVRLVRKTVKDLWSNADVVVFGSFDTMLYLPTSCYKVTVISKAKVPLGQFKESITGIPVDISFNLTNGIDSGQVISTYINEIPALRPLTMLVKYFLMIQNHNEVYKGGIGSYTDGHHDPQLPAKHPQIQVGNIDPMDNLGVLLIEFFELYGLCFNYTRVGLTRYKPGPRTLMDDKRVSSSHVQFDDRNRVAADSKQKSSGLHRSTQVSLIKEVYQVPMHIIRHRQKIAKVFLDGTYQVMFGDPIVHSLDLKTV
ncbi:MAG: hypothetical protein J3Q66DRAFT_376241 [Benniella sp.]|nr:MAG: hypothetical protein J3Q66DRAFT_376241 [Benniella sp.]